MKKKSGVYTIPCGVNGLDQLEFIFDTGAGNVVISMTEALYMYKHNYLTDNDFIGITYSQLADGKITENSKINLREIEIEGLKLYNVTAVIMDNPEAPLLLGQSALSKLGKITFDPEKGTLTILKK